MTLLLNHPQVKPLLSYEHFSVYCTLIEACASQLFFRPKDSSDDDSSYFHSQNSKNDTHASTTDPESLLYRKATLREAKLSYIKQMLMDNRHCLAVRCLVTDATVTAKRDASEAMLKAKVKSAS